MEKYSSPWHFSWMSAQCDTPACYGRRLHMRSSWLQQQHTGWLCWCFVYKSAPIRCKCRKQVEISSRSSFFLFSFISFSSFFSLFLLFPFFSSPPLHHSAFPQPLPGLKNLDLKCECLRGQGYNGSGSMVGAVWGASSVILRKHPLAVFVHWATYWAWQLPTPLLCRWLETWWTS